MKYAQDIILKVRKRGITYEKHALQKTMLEILKQRNAYKKRAYIKCEH